MNCKDILYETVNKEIDFQQLIENGHEQVGIIYKN